MQYPNYTSATTMTNPNKHQRAFLKICIEKYSHSTQEQSYGAGFALKAWSNKRMSLK